MDDLTERWPFRCELVGNHPHRGAVGTCHPQQRLQGMVLVTFEHGGSHGEDAAYADPSEVREIPEEAQQ